MEINYGKGQTVYGPGVDIQLTGDELATAVMTYLTAHDIYVVGPRTITVNGELCDNARIYVDPSGFAMVNGDRFSGRGPGK